MHRKWTLAAVFVLAVAWQGLAQNADEGAPSLGDVAKKNKDNSKSKAKRVITDDDVNVRSNPIPMIPVLGPDNTDEVLNAIREFKRTHDAAETERVVHEWFDEQSDVLSAAIEANARIAQNTQMKMEVQQDTSQYQYQNQNAVDYEGDYRRMQQRQISERRAQRIDARSNRDNWQIISRIQQTLAKVRVDVMVNHGKMAYDWFKIRNTNGVGSY
jgi:hypothetical protein